MWEAETSASINPKIHHGTSQHPLVGKAALEQDWHFLGRAPRHRGAVQAIPPAKLKLSSCCAQQTTCHCCLQPWPAQRQGDVLRTAGIIYPSLSGGINYFLATNKENWHWKPMFSATANNVTMPQEWGWTSPPRAASEL